MHTEKQAKDTPSRMFQQTEGKGTQQLRFEDNRESAVVQQQSYITRQVENGVRQRVKMRDERNISHKNMIQRKFYMGSIALINPELIRKEIEKKIDLKLKNGQIFADTLYRTYQLGDKNMDMSYVIKAMHNKAMEFYKYEKASRVNITKVLAEIDGISQDEVNNKIRENRILTDTRMSFDNQATYLSGVSNKEAVEVLRERWRLDNMAKADGELKKGKYLQEQYKNVNFRDFVHEIEYIDGLYSSCYNHVLENVLAMRNDLVASWYFNAKNEDEILRTKELQSYSVRRDLNPKLEGKSMFCDTVIHKTSGYFYSFIEHKDSKFNTGTRFQNPSTEGGIVGGRGVRDGSGRRLRFPFKKMVKAHAIIMGGDLTKDTQESKDKMKLTEPTPHKIFASGIENSPNIDTRMQGLLSNYVSFAFYRIRLAIDQGNDAKKHAIDEIIPSLLSKDGKDLWEYLTHYVANPQLMTPNKVSLGMKGLELDSSPKSMEEELHDIEEAGIDEYNIDTIHSYKMCLGILPDTD